MAFMLGANSIFYGEDLLTTPNSRVEDDRVLLQSLGLKALAPKAQQGTAR
jgi:biotin synthase